MTILDTFILKFVSDAKDAQKDTATLEKQLDTLGDKEKKRSEAEVKAHRELGKQRKETTRDIKEQTDLTDRLGGSFVRMVESGAQAATAFLALGAIKTGVLNVAEQNSNLQIQSKLWGKNITDIRAYSAAFEAAGGSADSFKNLYGSIFASQSRLGLPTDDPGKVIDRLRAETKKYATPEGKNNFLDSTGFVFDLGAKNAIIGSDAEYAEYKRSGFKNAPLKQKEADDDRAFEEKMAGVQQKLKSLYQTIADDVLPPLTKGMQGLIDILDQITKTPGGSEAAVIGGGLLSGWGVKKLAQWVFGTGAKAAPAIEGAAAGAAGLGVAGTLALAGLGTAGVAALIGKDRTSQIGSFTDQVGGSAYNPLNWGREIANRNRISELLLAGGLSRDNVNGILANLQTESSFNPQAVGDGGKAFGLAQWHPDRQANFAKQFGHDIRQSTLEEQVQFLLWELNNTHKKAGDKLQGANTPDSAAIFSQLVESPANGMVQAQQRAILATKIANETLGNASASPLNSSSSITNTTNGGDKNTNVKIDNVNVHTQATDADGMASAASDMLTNHIRFAMSGIDDGRLA